MANGEINLSLLETRQNHRKVLIDAQNDKQKKYNEEIKSLMKGHWLKSIDDIINAYVDPEMQNFSIFYHSMELSGEMEQLDLQIAEIRPKIKKHRTPGS